MLNQSKIIHSLTQEGLDLAKDIYLKEIVLGKSLVLIKNSIKQAGLATAITNDKADQLASLVNLKIKDILPWLNQKNTLEASIALAALNSLFSPTNCIYKKAQDILLEKGKGKSVAVIGHFPFVEKFRSLFKNFWVLELSPKPKDLPASKAKEILPQADLVAITATTLLNGTLAELLNLIPKHALKIMLGPSTPLANSLFNFGFNYLGGAKVKDFNKAKEGVLAGKCFKRLEGVVSILITAENFI